MTDEKNLQDALIEALSELAFAVEFLSNTDEFIEG